MYTVLCVLSIMFVKAVLVSAAFGSQVVLMPGGVVVMSRALSRLMAVAPRRSLRTLKASSSERLQVLAGRSKRP